MEGAPSRRSSSSLRGDICVRGGGEGAIRSDSAGVWKAEVSGGEWKSIANHQDTQETMGKLTKTGLGLG
jgi:hypothetical protein